MMTNGVRSKLQGKLSGATLSTTNPKWTALGMNLTSSVRSWQQTARLSHGHEI